MLAADMLDAREACDGAAVRRSRCSPIRAAPTPPPRRWSPASSGTCARSTAPRCTGRQRAGARRHRAGRPHRRGVLAAQAGAIVRARQPQRRSARRAGRVRRIRHALRLERCRRWSTPARGEAARRARAPRSCSLRGGRRAGGVREATASAEARAAGRRRRQRRAAGRHRRRRRDGRRQAAAAAASQGGRHRRARDRQRQVPGASRACSSSMRTSDKPLVPRVSADAFAKARELTPAGR